MMSASLLVMSTLCSATSTVGQARCAVGSGANRSPPAASLRSNLVPLPQAFVVRRELVHDPGVGHVEQLRPGQQVVVAEVVGIAEAFVGLVSTSEFHRIPVAPFGQVPPDGRLQVADA